MVRAIKWVDEVRVFLVAVCVPHAHLVMVSVPHAHLVMVSVTHAHLVMVSVTHAHPMLWKVLHTAQSWRSWMSTIVTSVPMEVRMVLRLTYSKLRCTL